MGAMTQRRLSLAVFAALAAACAAGCTGGPDDPAPTSDALAAALTAGDVSDLAFDGVEASDAQQGLDDATAGMGEATASVEATDTRVIDAEGATVAAVDLEVTWDLDGPGPDERTWTYPTQARLVPDEESAGWLVAWNPSIMHPDVQPGDSLSLARSLPPRADIVAEDGSPIVTARPVQRVGIDKVVLADTDADADPVESAQALAGIVGVDRAAYAERVESAGDEAFVEAIVLRDDDAESVRAEVEVVAGGRLLPADLPLAPTREFARPLIGGVGPATAEVVAASEGALVGDDLVGLSGLQARYDADLRGTAQYTIALRPAQGESVVLHTAPGQAGTPLVLTLDVAAQQRADDLLADIASPSAIVALRPSTGHVIALASGPGGDGFSTASLGRYAPGSIFKVATSLALLRSGSTPADSLPCTERITIDGKVFTNYSGYPSASLGDIALREALAQSCNTAFVSRVDVLDVPAVADAATSLGLTDASLGFDAFLGEVGAPATRVEQAANLIGQGTVLASPLGAATMVSAATGGAAEPVLVLDDAPASPTGAATVAEDEARDLTSMMRLAVTDGTADVLAGLPAPPVVAKTGTAEFGTATPPDTHGWMVAVQADLAVAVFVEQAESGSATAGPIMEQVLTDPSFR